MKGPLVQEIAYKEPAEVFYHFKHLPGSFLLDSAELREGCGRYSFIGFEPFLILSNKNGFVVSNEQEEQGDPWSSLASALEQFRQDSIQGLPPFQGGAVGYWSYESSQHLEKIPLAIHDDMKFDDMVVGFYDLVLAFDKLKQQAWIFSSGFPCLREEEKKQRAEKRLLDVVEHLKKQSTRFKSEWPNSLTITTTIASTDYEALVDRAKEYILAGDIFEVNLSKRFQAILPDSCDLFELYLKLRNINSAPFASYMHFPPVTIISASPERFVKLSQGKLETRPIKGTRPRGKTMAEDMALRQELLLSEKDRAENIMIVDLLRNDLSRVCEDFSVKVKQLCALESYATVHHLVSVVEGTLNSELKAVDALKALFPGGSITGAPKIRAMEIIAELEPTQRGPYCGCIGYIGFDGAMDTSITIRTFCVKENKLTFQAGGAVVADSIPAGEHEEVLAKAKALINALGTSYDPFN